MSILLNQYQDNKDNDDYIILNIKHKGAITATNTCLLTNFDRMT